MHYFKQLVSALSLGLFLTVETAFHATPPANAERQQDCVIQAIGYAADIPAPRLAHYLGVPLNRPVTVSNVTNYLYEIGFGRQRRTEFYTREAMMRHLRTNNRNAAYLIAWTGGGQPGHMINARVIQGEPIFMDPQCGEFSTVPENRERYIVWFVEEIIFAARKKMKRDLSKRDDRGATSTGNLTSSCRDIKLFTHVDRHDTVQLAAKCRTKRGSNLTGINLSDYIINSSGGFLWQKGGGFGGSARACRLEKSKVTVLQCEVKNRKGRWQNALINLDHRIFNDNGRLKVHL